MTADGRATTNSRATSTPRNHTVHRISTAVIKITFPSSCDFSEQCARYRRNTSVDIRDGDPAVTVAVARARTGMPQSAIDDERELAAERQAAKGARTESVATLADDYLKQHASRFKGGASGGGEKDTRCRRVTALAESLRPRADSTVRALVERVAEWAPIIGQPRARRCPLDAQLCRRPTIGSKPILQSALRNQHLSAPVSKF